MNRENIKESIGKFNNVKITVLGDLILDEYIFGSVDRISPEAPVPIVDVFSSKLTIGGSANAGLNIQRLGAKITIIGCLGDDLAGQKLTNLIKEQQINTEHLFKAPAKKTIHKTRIVSKQHNQQLLRIDNEDLLPITDDIQDIILDKLKSEVVTSDALLISDYSKGLVTEKLAQGALDIFKSLNKVVVVDSKAFNLMRFAGATVLTPNQKEAEHASGIRIHDDRSLLKAGRKLLAETRSNAILITRGENGCALFESAQDPQFVRSFASEVFDVTGAGDTVASVLTLSLATGLDLTDSVYLANIAAGITVKHFGAYAPSKQQILETMDTVEQY